MTEVVVVLLAGLVFLPGVVSIGLSCYYVVMWSRSCRGASTRNQFLITLLGPLAILVPRLMTDESRRHLTRFIFSGLFSAVYSVLLLVLFGKI